MYALPIVPMEAQLQQLVDAVTQLRQEAGQLRTENRQLTMRAENAESANQRASVEAENLRAEVVRQAAVQQNLNAVLAKAASKPEAIAASLAKVSAAVKDIKKNDTKKTLVDTKGLDKPEKFDNKEEEFMKWSRSVEHDVVMFGEKIFAERSMGPEAARRRSA